MNGFQGKTFMHEIMAIKKGNSLKVLDSTNIVKGKIGRELSCRPTHDKSKNIEGSHYFPCTNVT